MRAYFQYALTQEDDWDGYVERALANLAALAAAAPALHTGRGAPWARTRLESPDGVLFSRTADGGTYRPARCWTTVSALAANVVRAPE